MDFDMNFFLLLVGILMGYVSFKIGYWWGCRRGMIYAIDQLQDAANTLKQIGEKVYADSRREV